MANLFIIPTPIGNLEDLTLRAINTLKEVSTILCEDTRVTQKLLNHLEIKDKKLISNHEHNEEKRVKEILELLDSGEDLALVSDAGTPLISDPGSVILKALYEHNENLEETHKIIPLPGASALTSAISACPFETSRFTFHGFLPNSGQHRRRVLKKIKEKEPEELLVFYESPHRIKKTLKDIESIFSETEIFLARELTKLHEEFYLGTASDLVTELEEQFKSEVKGEMVLILSPKKLLE